MRNIVNWKTFFILSAACVIGSILVIPFQVALVPETQELGVKLYLIAFLQSIILFPIVVFLGLILAKKTGFELPIIEGKNKLEKLRSILRPSILWGILGGVLVILFSLLFWEVSFEMLKAETTVPTWAGFIAGFYGGIAEEVLFRLFLTSLIVWILIKIKIPKTIAIWFTIIVTNVVFGLGHLGITGAITDIVVEVVIRSVLLNCSVGIICGWLYWKKGLESAMVAHFSSDMVLHVITPFVAKIFIG